MSDHKSKEQQKIDSESIILTRVSGTTTTISSLVKEISTHYGYDSDTVIERLIDLRSQGRIKLHEKNRYSSFPSYAIAPISAWFWVAISVVLASVCLVLFTSNLTAYPRYAFGSLLILFLPGYALTELFYARKDAATSMKIMLSIGLSLAIVSLTGLILNETPYLIRPLSIVTSLAGLTMFLLILALSVKYRQYRITISEETSPLQSKSLAPLDFE